MEQTDTAPPYDAFDRIYPPTWVRRTSGIVAGALLGGGYGMVIGAVMAALPAAFVAAGLLAPTAIAGYGLMQAAAAVATFTGVGMITGVAAGSTVGVEAGGIAAGVEIIRRDLQKAHPELRLDVQPANPPLAPKNNSLFSLGTAGLLVPTFAALGAVFGMHPSLMGTAFASLPMFAPSAAAAGAFPVAAVAASSIAFGLVGVAFSFRNSFITRGLNDYFFDTITQGGMRGAQEFREKEKVQAKTALSASAPQEEHDSSEKKHTARITKNADYLAAILKGDSLSANTHEIAR